MAGNYELNINSEMDRDINTLRQADSELETAMNAINGLARTASGMKGQTGEAITQKVGELEKRVQELRGNIAKDIAAIQRAKTEYQQRDAEAAGKIVSM